MDFATGAEVRVLALYLSPAASDLGSMLTEVDALLYDAKRRRKAANKPAPEKTEGRLQDTAVRQ